jgi:alpha-beta hydrolase superfamily lysophospholipase
MNSTRTANEKSFDTHDSVSLFYRHWSSSTPRRGAVVMFHRGHEHSGRIAHLVDELNLPDFDFFAWDARGHGKSPGDRGFSPSFGTSVRDVQTFIEHISKTYGIAQSDIFVLAQSVGAVVASTWAHDYAPQIRGMSLASPAFKVKLYVPFARSGLALMQKIRGLFYVQSYVKAKFLTHDPARIASFENDPLITRAIAVNILLGLYEAAERVVKDAQAIVLPTQLLISGADWVVHHQPQHDFFARLSSPVKEKIELPGFFHDTLGEKDRADAVAKVRAFILRLFDFNPPRMNLLNADTTGPTADESRELVEPLAALSPRGLYWSAYRANLKIGGLTSDGIKLGHETGFDSGSTLDYVYRNKPSGAPIIGKMIDKTYLDAIGWRGIRQRKLNVEELLREAIKRLHVAREPARVMDIAAGHGRYVLEALQGESKNQVASILLRDYSDINVRDGQALIVAKGLEKIARFVKADAFDRASIAAEAQSAQRPNIGIVSGLYELFADNKMVGASLAGMGEAIAPGGYLVYTGQPWHPQLEMIARALTSHRQGQAWIMRRRTQAEMDQLVEAAGFTKIAQRVDEWGIFTVSLAVRNSTANNAQT